jgi:hypothetical protein
LDWRWLAAWAISGTAAAPAPLEPWCRINRSNELPQVGRVTPISSKWSENLSSLANPESE